MTGTAPPSRSHLPRGKGAAEARGCSRGERKTTVGPRAKRARALGSRFWPSPDDGLGAESPSETINWRAEKWLRKPLENRLIGL
jgi:hypothetical protein